MKYAVFVFLFLYHAHSICGQTLARYGDHVITRNEFLAAFKKNNIHGKATGKAYRDYLNLYIRYRLKVQAAYDLKLDTLPGQVTELQNFKSQIIDQYMLDESSMNQMAKEAFTRSQYDLRISYIFVAAPKNFLPADTAKAWKKIQEALHALKSGKDFGETALQFSEDPFVKNNSGDIGFITVFDLPYTMETVAYQTPSGTYSPVFRTESGYIILKKTAVRPAYGRIRAAQILMAFPYQASADAKVETKRRADSIYQALQAGSDFAELARKFSGDNLSYQLGGLLPEFGIGKYEPGFENTAFRIKNDGDLSAPYQSEFGYHIIKRIKRIPVSSVPDQKTLDLLKDKIRDDPRISLSRKLMLQDILNKTQFKEWIPPGNRLWDYTDSVLQNKKPAVNTGISEQSVLFQFAYKKYLAGDWILYRKNLKSAPNLTNGKTDTEIFDIYRETMAFDYYREHLEEYNPAFAAQVKEFRDGNLLFEVMQRKIWNPAAADSAGLKKYFEAHAASYWWKPGAEAIIFTTTGTASSKQLKKYLVSNIKNWRKIVDSAGGQTQADSGRFEMNQIPGHTRFEAGHFTGEVINPDHTVQFAYILHNYAGSSPRSFEEARGLVINDYQNQLEDEWIQELKKKYPVIVNEVVFSSLPK